MKEAISQSFTIILDMIYKLKSYEEKLTKMNQDEGKRMILEQIDEVNIFKNQIKEFAELFLAFLTGEKECEENFKGLIKSIKL